MEILNNVLVFVFGIVAGVLLDIFKDQIVSYTSKQLAKRATKRQKKIKKPLPNAEFPIFTIGNVKIPVASVIGSPTTPFKFHEIEISFKPIINESKEDYPIALTIARPFLLEEQMKTHNLKEPEFNNLMLRLDNVYQKPEDQNDHRGNMVIDFSMTTYGSFFATNLSLDYAIIPHSGAVSKFFKNQTIREAYCSSPLEVNKSFLSNPIGVDICIVSRNINQIPNDQMIIRKRSQNVKLYQGFFQAAASGYINLSHIDENSKPNPFVTAVIESKQEISDGIHINEKDFNLLGLSLQWEELHWNFYGFFETGQLASELIGDFNRDSYEGQLYTIPFAPNVVIQHIAKENWQPASVLCIISTLLHFFPRNEIEDICRKVPSKDLKSYFNNK